MFVDVVTSEFVNMSIMMKVAFGPETRCGFGGPVHLRFSGIGDWPRYAAFVELRPRTDNVGIFVTADQSQLTREM